MANQKKKWNQLKADGWYGTDISAYNEQDAHGKQQFLRDAKALLREVAAYLARHGLTESEINVNPGGMAGSGDVYGHFWNPKFPGEMVYCTIGASFVGHGRKDHLIILARKEERIIDGLRKTRRNWRTGQMGTNQWIDPGKNSLELATTLLKIMGLTQEVNDLTSVAYHSQHAGAVPFPSLVISGNCDATQWFIEHTTLQRAMRDDA